MIQKFSRYILANLHRIISILLLCDWGGIFSEMLLFWGPNSVLGLQTQSFYWRSLSTTASFFGIGVESVIYICWSLTAVSFAALFFKPLLKYSSFCSWLLINFWMSAGNSALYGVYYYFSIALLLLFLSEISRDSMLLQKWGKIFLCLTYFSAGWAKLMSPMWQSGQLIWNLSATILIAFGISSTAPLAHLSILIVFSSWLVILTQLSAPILLFRKGLSNYWLAIDCVIHLAIALVLGLYLFSIFLIVLNIAFLPEPKGRRALN